MNELKKKLLIFLVLGMVVVFVSYHVRRGGSQVSHQAEFHMAQSTEPVPGLGEDSKITKERNKAKNPRNKLKSSLSKVVLSQGTMQDLMTKAKASNRKSVQPQIPHSALAPEKRKILAPLKDKEEADGSSSQNYSLPQDVIERVNVFTFFIGYSRSGSSIISSLMDAHPHMIVAYQYKVFTEWNSKLSNKAYLYSELYEKSQEDARTGWRSEGEMAKSYTLRINTGWQGAYETYISVIGDKNAARTVGAFMGSKSKFTVTYTQLQQTVKVPIKVVFVVRNPYDIISTRVLYQNADELRNFLNTKLSDRDSLRNELPATAFKLYMKKLKEKGDEQVYTDNKFRTKDLKRFIRSVAQQASAISDMIDVIGRENVWEVHNMDLVGDPKSTMLEMCSFFNVNCSTEYIQTCVDSVFKSVSKSRELVSWPETETQLVTDNVIKAFPFFSRYTFESD